MTDPVSRARAVLASAEGPLKPLYLFEGSGKGWPQPMPQGYEGEFEAHDLAAIVLAVNAMPALLSLAEAAADVHRVLDRVYYRDDWSGAREAIAAYVVARDLALSAITAALPRSEAP